MEKPYEGTVQITSAEYRELVTEAVSSRHLYEEARSEKWKLESEITSLKKELAEANKNLDMCREQLSVLAAARTNQCNTWGISNRTYANAEEV